MYISFLGLGQGGSNIADEAAKNGFYSACINYSQKDLDSLEHVELKLKLVGSEGIGKQRSEAIRLMNNNWDLAINFVKENFSHSSIEIIFVPFASSGGSGSGIAPVLLNMLVSEIPDKVFVAMPIIPDKKESYTNQRNCLETFEDLSSLEICTMPIDNDQVCTTMSNIGKGKLYRSVNEKVIHLISKLLEYTEKNSKNGVLDKKDLKNILNTKGIGSIAEINISKLSDSIEISPNSIANKINQSWMNGIFTPIEFDQIISAGIIYDGQEGLMDYINVEKIFSSFGNKMPISLFEGYYNEGEGNVITVLTGLPWCNTRLQEIEDILEKTSDAFHNLNTINSFKSKIIDSPSLSSKPQKTKQKVNDITSLINKFKR